jgi:hypothetical protein
VEVDLNGVRAERARQFDGPWLGLELLQRVGLMEFLREAMPPGKFCVTSAARRIR